VWCNGIALNDNVPKVSMIIGTGMFQRRTYMSFIHTLIYVLKLLKTHYVLNHIWHVDVGPFVITKYLPF
jgi:hypothetical protein